MITLGIDPDSKATAFAIWDDSGPVSAHVVRSAKGTGEQSQVSMARALMMELPLSKPQRIAIEGQQIDGRRTGRGDLFVLAHVTGACIAAMALLHPEARILVPTPWDWKRGVPKHAMQARLFDQLGWGYKTAGSGQGRYSQPVNVPRAFQHISAGQWKHVGDALLLAKWAHDQ